MRPVGSAACASRLGPRPKRPGDASRVRTSSWGERRSTPARCGLVSCSCPSWPSATATTSSTTALAAGAPAYLTARARRGSATAVVVADTASALMDLGRWARTQASGRLGDRVIGITGSVGKTSVKDLTAAALRARWRTAANDRSYNNEQGLPVTLLEAADDAEALVLEMGMRGPGEIAPPVRGRPAGDRDRDARRRRPHRTPGRRRGRGQGQGRTGRRPAGPRHRHPQRRRPARGGDGLPHRGPDADVRNHGGGRRPRPRPGAVRRCPSPIPLRHAMG